MEAPDHKAVGNQEIAQHVAARKRELRWSSSIRRMMARSTAETGYGS
jgi:hypothetical protein